MPHRLQTLAELDGIPTRPNGASPATPAPVVYSAADLMKMHLPAPKMLIESLIPMSGASLLNGAAKSGKTILATQIALAVASGISLFRSYRVLDSGPVLMVEQDDPAGMVSIRDILQRSPIPAAGLPFNFVEKVPFTFGSEFLQWLESKIKAYSLRLVVLDSYTALRGSRAKGVDIVKAEQDDLRQIDDLAKRTNCAALILHHVTASKVNMDWSLQTAGTYAMAAATEAQIHISRFSELDTAPERLVRARPRHGKDLEMVLRFREETLDYDHVLDGGASPLYPLILEIKNAFSDRTFSPKDLTHATGVNIRTAHRHIDRLYRAEALTRRTYGEYVLRVTL